MIKRLSPEIIKRYLESVGEGKITPLHTRIDPLSDPRFRKLVKKDLRKMVDNTDLDVEDPVVRILLVQSVLGHAQNGHCEFRGDIISGERGEIRNRASYIYPHATIPHIIAAAGLDPEQTKLDRQTLVDNVYQWVYQALEGKPNRLTLKNEPLLGVNFLRDYHVDPTIALKGMVLAGYMDKFQSRMATLEHFNHRALNGSELRIGGGETYLVDPNILILSGFDYDSLANIEHNDDAIRYLRALELIVDSKAKHAESAFIRRKEGPGTSDDLAFLVIGAMYGQQNIKDGISAMLGAFVVDAVDTYDKCVMYPAEKGLDEALADYIQEMWDKEHGQPLVSPQEIRTVIYLSAKHNVPKVRVSSSHRRLIQYHGDEIYRPTLQSHIAHLKGEETGDFKVGFGRMESKNFYKLATQRLEKLDRVLEEVA